MRPLSYEGKAPTLTSRFLFFAFKWLSAFLVSFTLATIFLGLIGFGVWSFVFLFVAIQAAIWKLLYKANLIFVMIFDAVFVVVVIAFKLYVILGPNF